MDDRNSNEVQRTDRARSARKNRKGPDYRLAYIVGAALVLILIIVGIILGAKSCSKKETKETPTEAPVTIEETEAPKEEPAPVPEVVEDPSQKAKEAEIASYANLGIVQVSDGGYLNMREQPNTECGIVGKIYNHSACSIDQGTLADEWVLISSGGFSGYVKSEYLVSGDEAKSLAMEYISKRAIVTADALNVRAEPDTGAAVLGKVHQGERYEVQGEPEGWIRIDQGYISADYVEIRECLNEARKMNE